MLTNLEGLDGEPDGGVFSEGQLVLMTDKTFTLIHEEAAFRFPMVPVLNTIQV